MDFKPGDIVRGETNPAYHVPNRPFFDTIEMKGGGDAASAARAVLQTGEYDYAWNMQVEDDILRRLEQGGKGRVNIWPTGNPEHIQCNFTDPWTEVDGERSQRQDDASRPLRPGGAPGPQPAGGPRRGAGADLRPRRADQRQLPQRARRASSRRTRAGSSTWTRRTRSSTRRAGSGAPTASAPRTASGCKFLFQTSINAPRQKNQAIVKQAAAKAGIEMELKSVVASVFFSSDPANPDTYPHFYADLQMYNTTMTAPDPQYFMNQFCSWEVSQKANKWQGRNITRWRSEEYDRIYRAADSEIDPVKRAALFIKMNDIVIANVVVIPVLWRNGVSGLRRPRSRAWT